MPGVETNTTIVDYARSRAQHQPDVRGYTFLPDGMAEAGSLSYAEVDRQARSIAVALCRLAKPGDRALLLYPQGLDYIAGFFGCLYAGLIAVPAYPPRVSRGAGRIQAIAADAGAAVTLTTAELLRPTEERLAEWPASRATRWLATDELAGDAGGDWQPPAISGDTVAYLQYTSGSTASPKGVVVTHDNLMHNLLDLERGWLHTPDTVFVTWLPIFHDMGLVYGIVQPLYTGLPCFLLPPASFIQRPVRWLRAMSRYRGTHSAGPNFAYDLCVRKIKPEDRAGLDLSSWSVAVNAAEPVRLETMRRFEQAFAPCGFRWNAFAPGYGLAEATLKVSASRKLAPPVFCHLDPAALEKSRVVEVPESSPHRTLVGCGPTTEETSVAIVRPESGMPCNPDEIGEIWVAGPSNAHGYWNRPEVSAATFQARMAGDADTPFMRTGDLGFVRHGEVFVAGRLKDMIIIRGQNHYPQDIELTAERSHPALRPAGCGAFAIEKSGEERLVIAQEVERDARNVAAEELTGAIREAVAEEHELLVYDVVLLKPGGLPRTSSGKVQRAACRAGYLDGTLDLWTSRARTATAGQGTEL